MSDKNKTITDDGYIIVPAKKPAKLAKGAQCGACGMKFDYGKAYGYSCRRSDCPIFPQVTS